MVRTVHCYAFAVLRLAAQRNGDPPPRLITSAEQDGIIRELLAGDLEDGADAAVAWPPQLRPALSTVGFANELRDLLARCAERGVDPLRCNASAGVRPAGMGGRRPVRAGVRAGDAAAGRGRDGRAAGHDPGAGRRRTRRRGARGVRDRPRTAGRRAGRVRLLLVDDAQHLDPQAARLVRVLAAGAELDVIAGDPNQSVFGYRGADPARCSATATRRRSR